MFNSTIGSSNESGKSTHASWIRYFDEGEGSDWCWMPYYHIGNLSLFCPADQRIVGVVTSSRWRSSSLKERSWRCRRFIWDLRTLALTSVLAMSLGHYDVVTLADTSFFKMFLCEHSWAWRPNR